MTQPPEGDDSAEYRELSELEEAMLATFEEQIVDLAQRAVEGEADVGMELSQLIDGAPDTVRVELARRFHKAVDELHESRGIDEEEISAEMEAEKKLIREREQMFVAHWLSKETLDRIRKVMLSNPALIHQIVSIGEELNKRGVFFDTRKQQVTAADLGAVVATPTVDKPRDKDTKER